MPARQRIAREVLIPGTQATVWRRLTAPGGLDWLGRRVDVDLRPRGVGVVVDDRGERLAVEVLEFEVGLVRWRWQAEDGTGQASEVAARLEQATDGTRIIVEEAVGEAVGEPVAVSTCPPRSGRMQTPPGRTASRPCSPPSPTPPGARWWLGSPPGSNPPPSWPTCCPSPDRRSASTWRVSTPPAWSAHGESAGSAATPWSPRR